MIHLGLNRFGFLIASHITLGSCDNILRLMHIRPLIVRIREFNYQDSRKDSKRAHKIWSGCKAKSAKETKKISKEWEGYSDE